MFRYLLFDLDGTILDTNEIIFRSFEYTLKVHLDYDIQRQEILKIFGEPLFKQMTYFNPKLAKAMCQTYREYYAKHSKELTRVFPGVKKVLAHLKLHNIPMGIVTNKSRKFAEMALHDFQLHPFFDFLIGGDEVKNAKPDPEAIIKGMKLLKANPKETLMIGDSPLDLDAAKRAGIKSALVGWNIFPKERFIGNPPDFYLVQMTDLLQILNLDAA
ncbi:hypothetical protein BBF96_04515 [Anoxybacter fermentans]|uniref:Pyrophosphatase PpaX n=1 Tax=Anoxybacter fermentans TaxID=1323375 RepID=A0A3Q9HPL9_9FIRM|nr:HAD-IA family hydrolase [Anoxybacter fermentans]AZR72717.1 hypothetical protein BBF96_04515 [Anoxybacter fermentans]